MKNQHKHIPALSFESLTGFYDIIIARTMPENDFRNSLIYQAFKDNKNVDVLEFGVGTASNSILAKRLYPELRLTGVDVDTKILEIAQKKVTDANINVELVKYDGKQLPFRENSFSVVISSLVFHHLKPDEKQKAFFEINRVLKPNGKLVFVDWGKPSGIYSKFAFNVLRVFDGWKNTSDHASGNYHVMIERANFKTTETVKKFETVYGTLELVETSKCIEL